MLVSIMTEIYCRYIFDNGVDDRYHNIQFSQILFNDKLGFLYDAWYISPSLNHDSSEDIEDGKIITLLIQTSPNNLPVIIILDQITIHSSLDNYTNIVVRGIWNSQTIRKSGFVSKNLDRKMMSDLSWSYHNYFNRNILIINSKVTFYQQVSFEILDVDTSLKNEVKLHVGDIVDVSGTFDEEDDENQWFARIAAIIIHKNNDSDNCVFLVFDWFDHHNFDTNLKCHRYKLQRETDVWKRIHSITIITEQPKWHFIHDCRNTCEVNNHDLTDNRVFYKNEYLYTAV